MSDTVSHVSSPLMPETAFHGPSNKMIESIIMKLDYTELDNGIRLIALNGALDMNGTYSIEVQFVRYCAGDNIRVLVDLSFQR